MIMTNTREQSTSPGIRARRVWAREWIWAKWLWGQGGPGLGVALGSGWSGCRWEAVRRAGGPPGTDLVPSNGLAPGGSGARAGPGRSV